MIEIDKKHVIRWGAIENRNHKFAPLNIDIDCTNDKCRRSLVGSTLKWQEALDFSYSSLHCAACNEYIRFFLIDTPATINKEDLNKCRLLVIPPLSVKDSFSNEIKDISPSFVRIYKQAAESELLSLHELSGMGYRKALEFLIKDFIAYLDPNKQAEISKKPLSNCIAEHVTSPQIKNCANRTAWLGNDETHYMKKWVNHDLQDLKALLSLTVYWVESELLTKKYQGSMPK